MIKNFHNNVEMLLERMQKVSGQGKHIAMDATVQVCAISLGGQGWREGDGSWGVGEVIKRVCLSEVAFEFPFIFHVAWYLKRYFEGMLIENRKKEGMMVFDPNLVLTPVPIVTE